MAIIDDLISYYKLDESSGDAIDAHGSNDGTVSGATQNVSGKINTAYDFEQSNFDKINLNSKIFTSDTTTFSVGGWVKAEANGKRQFILGRTLGGYLWLGYQTADWTGIGMGVYDGSWHSVTDGSDFSVGSWMHIIGTYDGTTLRLYIAGVEVADTAWTGTLTHTGSNNMVIGDNNTDNVATRSFDGLLDEMGFWNKCLSPTEVLALSNVFPYPFISGWANKIFGIVPDKVISVDVANISKVIGVA